jgi:hypothetical protein
VDEHLIPGVCVLVEPSPIPAGNTIAVPPPLHFSESPFSRTRLPELLVFLENVQIDRTVVWSDDAQNGVSFYKPDPTSIDKALMQKVC